MSVLLCEAMCSGRYSVLTVLHDFALRIPVEWLVRILLLASMMLQLVLVVLGARRYLSSNGILRFVVWGAYISADAVAISALATMMHSDRRWIYAIWAPVLLMHLGGPDAITAYSMADNELWMRHGFNMIYQVSVAVYVIYTSKLKGRPLAAAILLLVVGFFKYGERTLALRYGSYPRIVMSSLPISKYMEIKSVAENCKYVVMGEDQFERMLEEEQASYSLKGRGKKKELETASVIEKKLETSPLKEKIVTIDDVKEANIASKGYDLCVSYALFKMYKRRFGSLYFVEGDCPRTRAFWVNRRRRDAFRVVEMELKFMYDAVFPKYSNTWFTKWGVAVRFVITILLGAAGYLILGERESRQAQRMVTYIVISVAFLVEVFQIWRAVVSDWTRVHLICAHVAATKREGGGILELWRNKVIKITMSVVGKFQDLCGRNKYLRQIVGGSRYWSNQIPQHCLIETWLNRSPMMYKMAGLFPKPDRYIVSWYTEIRHVSNVPVEDDLKDLIFEILSEACSEKYSSEECRQHLYNFEKDLFEGDNEIPEVLKPHGNLEEVILIWHIATTLCDSKTGSSQEKNVKLSRILSRYCAYLLLSRPQLLPLHPKMARIVYMQAVNQLLDTVTLGSILEKNPRDLFGCKDKLLGSAAKLAEKLRAKGEKESWKLLAQYWCKLVIYMAVYNKAVFHAESVAGGGEFLSLVWVLMAHMGCGEQSDSAVTKKVEMLSDKELAVADRNAELDEVKRKLTGRENELDEAKRKLTGRENELDAVKNALEATKKDREEKLEAATKKFKEREYAVADMEKNFPAMERELSDLRRELAMRKDGSSNPEEELAAMKTTVRDLREELAAKRRILRGRKEDSAAMRKNLRK